MLDRWFCTKRHLHTAKIIFGWIPYFVIAILALVEPTLTSERIWVFIALAAPLAQRIVIDTIEYCWELRNEI